jgi:ABC-type transport system involved in cytochrome c biogenesis ATPase subunit
MLTKLQIRNFRGFSDLTLTDFGLVNLIVGRNNAGKTSFLEAIKAACSPEQPQALAGLFRPSVGNVDRRFNRWLLRDGIGNDNVELNAAWTEGETALVLRSQKSTTPEPEPTQPFSVWSNGRLGFLDRTAIWKRRGRPLEVKVASVQHRVPEALVSAFGDAVRPKAGETQMESLLQAVDERVKSVRIDFAQNEQPFIVVDIGLSERVPLPQAGQGIYRLVAIFSELLGQHPDLCLIDEVENGIHYTALPQLWKGIAEAASRLKVQVFVTTHSHECLLAAHEAFAVRKDYDLRVIQLYRVGDLTEGRVLDQKHIQAAVDGEIELR